MPELHCVFAVKRTQPSTTAIVRRLKSWFERNSRDLPWRRTKNPYAIWVSEIMLQQTQVKTVLPFYERWMRELPDVKSLAELPPDRLHKLWEGLGYYTRVRNMQAAARQIQARHGGIFPQRYDEMLDLPGVGRYTAGAICSIAFNQATPVLDGNVMRVLTRLHAITRDPREKRTNQRLWRLAEQLVQAAMDRSSLNQGLMELGAMVCTPRQPRCIQCPLRNHCIAYASGQQEHLPRAKPRVRPTDRFFLAFAVQNQGRWLVRQRPAGQVNAHLWEFPNVELPEGKLQPSEAAHELLGRKVKDLKQLCTVRHTITRYRIRLQAFVGRIDGRLPHGDHGRWLSLEDMAALPFPSAHLKVRERLMG